MTTEQLALVSELQSQKLVVMCERDEIKQERDIYRAQNDRFRQCAQVLVIVGPHMLDGTADEEDRRLFAEALENMAALGGRR